MGLRGERAVEAELVGGAQRKPGVVLISVDVVELDAIEALDRAVRDAGASAAILGRGLLERRFTLAEALSC